MDSRRRSTPILSRQAAFDAASFSPIHRIGKEKGRDQGLRITTCSRKSPRARSPRSPRQREFFVPQSNDPTQSFSCVMSGKRARDRGARFRAKEPALEDDETGASQDNEQDGDSRVLQEDDVLQELRHLLGTEGQKREASTGDHPLSLGLTFSGRRGDVLSLIRATSCGIVVPEIPKKKGGRLMQDIARVKRFLPDVLIDFMDSSGVGEGSGTEEAMKDKSHFLSAACLCLDISGFTRLSEDLCKHGGNGLDSLVRLINDCMGNLVNQVYVYGGDVVKIAGDALHCVFRASSRPGGLREALQRALVCAAGATQSTSHGLLVHGGLGAGEMCLAVMAGQGRRDWIVGGIAMEQMCDAVIHASGRQLVLHRDAVPFLTYGRAVQGTFLSEGSGKGHLLVRSVSMPTVRKELAEGGRVGFTRAHIDAARISQLLNFVPRAAVQGVETGGEYLAEMRHVTTLFIRLDGYSSVEHRDLVTLTRYIHVVQSELQRFSGFLRHCLIDDKGCVLVAAWGTPGTCFNDNCERALETAVASWKALSAVHMPSSMGITTGRALCCCVGSKLRCAYAIVGDVVNLAARLMSMAEGRILCDINTATGVSQATRLSKIMHLLPQGRVLVKGKAFRVPICSVVPSNPSEGVDIVPFQAPSCCAYDGAGSSADIIGRVEVLNHIQSLLLSKTSSPQFVVLEGGGGTGKSFISHKIAECAHFKMNSNIIMLERGDSTKYSVADYAWARRLLLATLELDRPMDLAVVGGYVKDALQQWFKAALGPRTRSAEWAAVKRLLLLPRDEPAVLNLTPPNSGSISTLDDILRSVLSHQIASSDKQGGSLSPSHGSALGESITDRDVVDARVMVKLFSAAAAPRHNPVICIDDAHLMDAATWRVLPALINATAPALFLMTIIPLSRGGPTMETLSLSDKPSRRKWRPILSLMQLPACIRFELSPLTRQEVTQEAAKVISREDELHAVVDRIMELAGGGPYWTSQLLDVVREVTPALFLAETTEDGSASRGGDGVASKQGRDGARLAAKMVAHRLERLSPPERLVVRHASVVGDTVPLGLLSRVLPVALMRGGTLDLETMADGLVQKGFLESPERSGQGQRASASSAGISEGHTVYFFRHPLVRQALYNLTPLSDRRKIHEAVAKVHAAIAEDEQEALGVKRRNYSLASTHLQCALEKGDVGTPLCHRVVEYSVKAAAVSLILGDLSECLEHLNIVTTKVTLPLEAFEAHCVISCAHHILESRCMPFLQDEQQIVEMGECFHEKAAALERAAFAGRPRDASAEKLVELSWTASQLLMRARSCWAAGSEHQGSNLGGARTRRHSTWEGEQLVQDSEDMAVRVPSIQRSSKSYASISPICEGVQRVAVGSSQDRLTPLVNIIPATIAKHSGRRFFQSFDERACFASNSDAEWNEPLGGTGRNIPESTCDGVGFTEHSCSSLVGSLYRTPSEPALSMSTSRKTFRSSPLRDRMQAGRQMMDTLSTEGSVSPVTASPAAGTQSPQVDKRLPRRFSLLGRINTAKQNSPGVRRQSAPVLSTWRKLKNRVRNAVPGVGKNSQGKRAPTQGKVRPSIFTSSSMESLASTDLPPNAPHRFGSASVPPSYTSNHSMLAELGGFSSLNDMQQPHLQQQAQPQLVAQMGSSAHSGIPSSRSFFSAVPHMDHSLSQSFGQGSGDYDDWYYGDEENEEEDAADFPVGIPLYDEEEDEEGEDLCDDQAAPILAPPVTKLVASPDLMLQARFLDDEGEDRKRSQSHSLKVTHALWPRNFD
jgi:class 3 adenylate cyclase